MTFLSKKSGRSSVASTKPRMEEEAGFKPGRTVAFGSRVERLMFPVHTSPTRLGIEQGLRGAPHRGPGCYSPDPLTHFLKPLDSVPRSKRGWYFGACQAGRVTAVHTKAKASPAPGHTQTVDLSPLPDNKTPFNAVCPRWESKDRDAATDKPGPGTYEHEVLLSRHVEVDESFGSRRSLRNAVVMKCTKGIPDKCSRCKEETMGDYYQRGEKILCRECHKKQQTKIPTYKRFFAIKCWSHGYSTMCDVAYSRDMMRGYDKVRDCTGVHQHKFPGKDPKIILKSDSELKKLSNREAYFRLYFSD